MQNTFCFPFPLFFFKKKEITKTNLEWNAWMLCNANPKIQRKQKQQKDGHKEKSDEAQGPY